MFLNGAMWNSKLFPEPVGANIKKSQLLANQVLPLSFDYCNFVEGKSTFFTGSSRFVYVHFLSFLPCLHFKAKCLPGNWSVKYSALQVRKVCFPTDPHLTTRNWKQALRKSTYWLLAFQCLPITTDSLLCILHMRYFLASKQIRKSWYSKAKKTTLVCTSSYSGPRILEKTKETKVI